MSSNKLLTVGFSLTIRQAFIVVTANAKRRMDNKRSGRDEKNLTADSFETLKPSVRPAMKQLIGQFIPNDTFF